MPNEEIIKALLQLADERLKTGKRDLRAQAYRDAATRAYYAMFHATSALLNAMELQFKSHKGTVGLFGEHVVKAGLVEEEYGRMLNKSLDLRETADYKVTKEVTVKEARDAVASAEKFVSRIKELLKSKHGIGG
ncbi:MAG TPA: HEPN domain-containing protein [Candidatus Bipolaricaulota bacterium]